ncbi:aspartyl-phosphate phosphatase Spo0E family protein [Paenibacillus thiaminolyticus]|uniref:Spo0E family sporulation regulatory protein-aspartic acid phosphatase n=1 Tax=Paenibacillus thiaminolyticus TaxID=49283 RepID=UPI0035A64878
MRKIYFTDDEVVSVSQELDYYLVGFQREMMNKRTGNKSEEWSRFQISIAAILDIDSVCELT